MNNSTLLLIQEVLSSETVTTVQDASGLTEGVYSILGKIVEVLTTAGQSGFWKFLIVLFAIIGFFAVLAAIISKISMGFKVIFQIFILIPAIFIIGIINKKKRKQRLKEWGEIKKDFKENGKKIKLRYWVLWISTRILLPVGLIIFLLWIQLT